MIKHSLLGILLLVLFPLMLLAAEVENIRPQQIGNRILFEYDLAGDEEAEVTLTITVKGTVYTQDRLHLEGDYGKVKPGRNKKIYWNVLQDFQRVYPLPLTGSLRQGSAWSSSLSRAAAMIWAIPSGVEMQTKNPSMRSAYLISIWESMKSHRDSGRLSWGITPHILKIAVITVL